MNDQQQRPSSLLEIDPATIGNAVLRRLIDEVRNDLKTNITGYNRVHNRHNRGPNIPPTSANRDA